MTTADTQQGHLVADVICCTTDTQELNALLDRCIRCLTQERLDQGAASTHILREWKSCRDSVDLDWKRFVLIQGLAWSPAFQEYVIRRVPLVLRDKQKAAWSVLGSMLVALAENNTAPIFGYHANSLSDFVYAVTQYLYRTA